MCTLNSPLVLQLKGYSCNTKQTSLPVLGALYSHYQECLVVDLRYLRSIWYEKVSAARRLSVPAEIQAALKCGLRKRFRKNIRVVELRRDILDLDFLTLNGLHPSPHSLSAN